MAFWRCGRREERKMPSNNVGGVSVSVRLDDKDALQQLNKLRQKMLSLQADLDSKRAQRDTIAERLRIAGADADAARLKVEELKAALATAAPGDRSSLRAQLTDANAVLREQTSIVNQLDDQYVKLTNEIGAGEKNLAGMQNSASGLEEQIRASRGTIAQMQKAVQNATKAMERGFAQLGSMIRRVFVFTVALRALRALQSYLQDIFLSFPEIRAVLADIKGNLLTAIAPIVQALLPPLLTLLAVLRDVSAVLADIVSKIFGMTAGQAQDAAKGLNKQAEAYKKTGGAAAKAAKQLASFDKLNILNDGSSGGGSSSASGVNPTFGTDFTSFLKDQLGAIELLLGTALLALGAILAFTGVNIPLGITLMALGAASIWAAMKMDWDELKRQLQGPIGKILAILSAALLVLGAILTFTGANIPLGIALMAIGAAGLATAIVANWDTIKQALQGTIGVITAIVSAALLVLGAVLTFSGANIPLGIGLMIAGAAGLAAVVVANWDTIKEKLQGPIGTITAIVSGALLVLGAILTFSGANLPLGIGLMVAGAIGLAATAALNWDKIKSFIQGNFKEIMAIASAGLLVLGIILTIAGVLPLGIALIIAGAAGLVTVTALNWGAIKDKIVGVWDSIKSWWKANVAPVFTREWWSRLFSSIYQGLLEVIGSAKDAWSGFKNWITGEEKYTPYTGGLNYSVSPSGTLVVTPQGGFESLVPTNSEFSNTVNGTANSSLITETVNTLKEIKDMRDRGADKMEVKVFLDSREIRSGQENLARVTGGGARR